MSKEKLVPEVKLLRHNISVVIEKAKSEAMESPDDSVYKAIEYGTNAFMFLGKVLNSLGVENPYKNDDVTEVQDWTKDPFDVTAETIGINEVRNMRMMIDILLSGTTYNDLLDWFPEKHYSNHSWHFVMRSFTDLMLMKMWLGMYLNCLLRLESKEEKAERLRASINNDK